MGKLNREKLNTFPCPLSCIFFFSAEVVKFSEVIILAMKPQYLDAAIKSFESIPSQKLYVSILVGISIETLDEVRNTNSKKAIGSK